MKWLQTVPTSVIGKNLECKIQSKVDFWNWKLGLGGRGIRSQRSESIRDNLNKKECKVRDGTMKAIPLRNVKQQRQILELMEVFGFRSQQLTNDRKRGKSYLKFKKN